MEEKCLRIIEGKEGCCRVNFSREEPVFSGHFPEFPVMPGVLLLELLIGLGGKIRGIKPEKTFVKELNKIRFRQQVRPGDQIELEASVTDSALIKGRGLKNGRVVLEAEFLLQEEEDEG